MCKVTVITVTYNAEKQIEETMNSVVSQSFTDFEYIIKDGNSTDSTNNTIRTIIETNKGRELSIKHIISEDTGIYDAMNQAVSQATGEWVIFMNAGDVFYNSNVLSDVFSVKYKDQIGILYGHAMMRLENNRNFVVTYNAELMKAGCSICHQSVFEKRKYLLQYPFDRDLRILADREHMLNLQVKGVLFYNINSIIVKEDRNGISSVNYPQMYKETMLINKKYGFGSKHKIVKLERIKVLVKKILPIIEEWVMINKAMKRMGSGD